MPYALLMVNENGSSDTVYDSWSDHSGTVSRGEYPAKMDPTGTMIYIARTDDNGAWVRVSLYDNGGSRIFDGDALSCDANTYRSWSIATNELNVMSGDPTLARIFLYNDYYDYVGGIPRVYLLNYMGQLINTWEVGDSDSSYVILNASFTPSGDRLVVPVEHPANVAGVRVYNGMSGDLLISSYVPTMKHLHRVAIHESGKFVVAGASYDSGDIMAAVFNASGDIIITHRSDNNTNVLTFPHCSKISNFIYAIEYGDAG